MLPYLKWPNLQDRRKVARLTLLFRILKKLVIIHISDHCLPLTATVSYTYSYHPLKLTNKKITFNGINYPSLRLTLTVKDKTSSSSPILLISWVHGVRSPNSIVAYSIIGCTDICPLQAGSPWYKNDRAPLAFDSTCSTCSS